MGMTGALWRIRRGSIVQPSVRCSSVRSRIVGGQVFVPILLLKREKIVQIDEKWDYFFAFSSHSSSTGRFVDGLGGMQKWHALPTNAQPHVTSHVNPRRARRVITAARLRQSSFWAFFASPFHFVFLGLLSTW